MAAEQTNIRPCSRCICFYFTNLHNLFIDASFVPQACAVIMGKKKPYIEFQVASIQSPVKSDFI